MRDASYKRSLPEPNESYDFFESDITTKSFNMDLQNLCEEDAQRAQDALEIMQELYEQRNDTDGIYVQPDASCYTTVIDGWLQSNHDHAPMRAQALLDRMEQLYDETRSESIRPNAVTYMLVCQTWAETYNDDDMGESAERAQQILTQMKQRGMQPDMKIYTLVLNAWARRAGRVRGAMSRAEAILEEMESYAMDADDSDSVSIKPNVIHYTTVISGYSRCKERDLATKAQAMLDRMERNGVQPDMVAYTSVLNAWAKSKSRKEREVAATRAVDLMKKMEDLYAQEFYNVKPNLISYSTGISAIGNSLDPAAPEMAERVLRHMYDLNESGAITGIKPSTATFNAVITVMARCRLRRGRKTARRAEQLLVEMVKRTRQGEENVQPSVKTWGGLILAWAESGLPDAAENAQRVLDKMEALYRQGDSTVEPNVVCFTTVMKSWCSSGRVDRAEEILKKLEHQFEVTGDKEVRPNSITYVTLIDGLVRQNAPNAAQRAQETVDRMVKLYAKGSDLDFVRPSRIVFNSLINAWSRCSEPRSAQKAEQILKWMETQYQAGDKYVKPDEVTFCGVLNAWANHAESGGAQRAQQIMEHMESLAPQERGFPQTVVCYNIVIKAWARSGDPNAIQHVQRLLERLEGHNSLHPDTTTYSSIINCCAYYNGDHKGRGQVLSFALQTFEKLCGSQDERPNHITYGTLFKAVSKLTDAGKDRDELVETLFHRCCSDGQVDAFVLSQVRNACSARVFQELVFEPIGVHGAKGEANIRTILRKMPSAWARNRIE